MSGGKISENAAGGSDFVDLDSLLSEFYASPETLGHFERVETVPAPFDELLDHNHHMTVTVEAFHGDEVDVVVQRSRSSLDNGDSVWQNSPNLPAEKRLAIAESTLSYSREITLQTRQTKNTVQYGIVRLNPAMLQRQVWMEIAGGETPLGRVLIQHNVLRSVELCRLWKVTAGVALARWLGLEIGEVVYGRTALIRCDNQPAIELLEIVVEDATH